MVPLPHTSVQNKIPASRGGYETQPMANVNLDPPGGFCPQK